MRHRLTECPREFRECSGPDGNLSFKETLAHIAFWEDYTVNFFSCKIERDSRTLSPPVDFENLSRKSLEEYSRLPFGEVLARYLEAAGAMIDFIQTKWGKLTERERHDFWVPLKHRRQHRLMLFQTLDGMMTELDPGPASYAAKA